MRADEIKTWLYPLDAWIKANVQAEDDPEGQWHLTSLAWQKLNACFDTCALGEPPLWSDPDVQVDLELMENESVDTEETAEESEVSDLQAMDMDGLSDSESSDGESSELREGSAEEIETVNEERDS